MSLQLFRDTERMSIRDAMDLWELERELRLRPWQRALRFLRDFLSTFV